MVCCFHLRAFKLKGSRVIAPTCPCDTIVAVFFYQVKLHIGQVELDNGASSWFPIIFFSIPEFTLCFDTRLTKLDKEISNEVSVSFSIFFFPILELTLYFNTHLTKSGGQLNVLHIHQMWIDGWPLDTHLLMLKVQFDVLHIHMV